MTLKEFLDYRERRFDSKSSEECDDYYRGYMDGWEHAIRDVIVNLERHGVNLEISLD